MYASIHPERYYTRTRYYATHIKRRWSRRSNVTVTLLARVKLMTCNLRVFGCLSRAASYRISIIIIIIIIAAGQNKNLLKYTRANISLHEIFKKKNHHDHYDTYIKRIILHRIYYIKLNVCVCVYDNYYCRYRLEQIPPSGAPVLLHKRVFTLIIYPTQTTCACYGARQRALYF